jgi:hypothetical protein
MFVPDGVRRIRAVFVAIDYVLGQQLASDPQWRRLAESLDSAILQANVEKIQNGLAGRQPFNDATLGGGEGLLTVLQRLADETGHPELSTAPLLFWGFSAAGAFGSSFAGLYPERTLGFVRYHSGPFLGGDVWTIGQVPGLFFVAGQDSATMRENVTTLWRSGRALGAAWTYAFEPHAVHGSNRDRRRADDLLMPWIAAVMRHRVLPDGTLRAVTDATGLLADIRSGSVMPSAGFAGPAQEASWLPEAISARGWRLVQSAPALPR